MWYEQAWLWAKEHLTITVPGVVLIFAATYIVMLAVNAGEAGAAWVQAIGSIAAILAAWMIPHFHERARMRKAQNDIYDSAGWLALRIQNDLENIIGTIERAAEEENPEDSVRTWRMLGGVADSATHKNAANELPLSAFTGDNTSYLIAIRVCAEFCVECAQVLDAWDFEKDADLTQNFPLKERFFFHQHRIEWAKENTLDREGGGVSGKCC